MNYLFLIYQFLGCDMIGGQISSYLEYD